MHNVIMCRVSSYHVACLQEMPSSGSCQVQDSLSCSVCFERFDDSTHLPKILPCQHTFCGSCIDNLIDDSDVVNAFECPFCRAKVSSNDGLINLAVKDIVEAVITKERTKLFCPKHPAKDCQLICTDCLQFICGVCAIKGEHVGHTIDDIDDATIALKKRLTTSFETKIATLEKVTAAKVDKLNKELAKQEQDMNNVIHMINEAMNKWKKTQLQKVQQTIETELEVNKAQQASLREKLPSIRPPEHDDSMQRRS